MWKWIGLDFKELDRDLHSLLLPSNSWRTLSIDFSLSILVYQWKTHSHDFSIVDHVYVYRVELLQYSERFRDEQYNLCEIKFPAIVLNLSESEQLFYSSLGEREKGGKFLRRSSLMTNSWEWQRCRFLSASLLRVGHYWQVDSKVCFCHSWISWSSLSSLLPCDVFPPPSLGRFHAKTKSWGRLILFSISETGPPKIRHLVWTV